MTTIPELNNAEAVRSAVFTLENRCLQDDSSHNLLVFDSQTGAYGFSTCGAGGVSLTGTGSVQIKGNMVTLVHNASDRRILAKFDLNQKKGTAVVQTLGPTVTYTIVDRSTLDNTCGCP